MADPAIQVYDLSKRYGLRWALARLSFTLAEGESLLLTGHNGSGKTTLLRVLATLLSPTAGKVRLLGLDSQEMKEPLRSQIGLLSHANYLYEDLSARENLLLHARLLGISTPKPRIAELLDQVGLSVRADSVVREFSAGMRKRVSLARLLLKAPKVALLDEPFGELDPAGIRFTEGLIRKLQERGATVVLATHLIDQGLGLCQRRLHLQDGREANA